MRFHVSFCLDAVDDKGGAWRASGEAVWTVWRGVRVKIVRQLRCSPVQGAAAEPVWDCFLWGRKGRVGLGVSRTVGEKIKVSSS